MKHGAGRPCYRGAENRPDGATPCEDCRRANREQRRKERKTVDGKERLRRTETRSERLCRAQSRAEARLQAARVRAEIREQLPTIPDQAARVRAEIREQLPTIPDHFHVWEEYTYEDDLGHHVRATCFFCDDTSRRAYVWRKP